MRKMLTCGAVLAVAAAGAAAPTGAETKPDKPYKCVPKKVGYKASGKLASESLTQTAGATTPKRGDDRYSGELTVIVTRANHKGQKGEQKYAVENARVRFRPRSNTDPEVGTRVKVRGKMTRVGKKCEDFTSTVTVRKVDFKAPKGTKK